MGYHKFGGHIVGFHKLVSVIIIVSIMLFMYRSVENRPVFSISNEISQTSTAIELNEENMVISQKIDAFHHDRTIESVYIKFNGMLSDGEKIRAELSGGGQNQINDQSMEIGKDDIDTDGWCRLNFDYNGIEQAAILSLFIQNPESNIELNLADDIDNLGSLQINGESCNQILTMKICGTINHIFWDKLYKYFIPVYFLIALLTLVWLSDKKEDIIQCRIMFVIATGLNILCCYIFVPYLFQTPHIAENALNYYYLTEKNSVWKCLFMSDAGYLPLCQRLISIFYIKILKLGTDALYWMQGTGVVLDACMAGAICLYSNRRLADNTIRFSLSLMIMALFSNSTVSTFFDFIYLGYFIILLVLTCEISEMTKPCFVAVTIVSGFICLSKGFYVVFLPFGVIILLALGRRLEARKVIYISSLMVFSLIQTAYALIKGGVWQKLDLGNRTANMLPFICMVLFMAVIILAFLIKCKATVAKWIDKLNWEEECIAMMVILMCGSFLLAFMMTGGVSGLFFFDWGLAWYIPGLLAALVGYLLMIRLFPDILKWLGSVMLIAYFIAALGQSGNKCHVNNNCVAWGVYKDYFLETIVPVYKYDTRFGTMSDHLALCYSDESPRDNYEYGAPYLFQQIPVVSNSDDMTCEFILHDESLGNGISAIYLNYLGEVGNHRLQLECWDKDGNLIRTVNQITPPASKTIGFIVNGKLNNVNRISVVSENKEEAYVENKIYIVRDNE